MKVEAVALTDFHHDDLHAREGRALSLEESLAHEMERKGLIRIRLAPLRGKRVLGLNPGKLQAAGEGKRSSSSPVAQASIKTISPSSVRGVKRPQRSVR